MGAAFKLSEQTFIHRLPNPLTLDSGATLPNVEIAYRTWGSLAAARDNAIVICHALTGSADADVWWEALLGPGKAIDTDRWFVICGNVLGGCYGTTGPTSIAPDGGWWAGRFPSLTIRDQVRAQVALADALRIRGIHAVIGGSLGGLQALEWGWIGAGRVRSIVSLAASGRHSAWCVAWGEAQRAALKADPKYCDGKYPPNDPPRQGLAAARAIAMVGYRSPVSLARRFGRSADDDGRFSVNSWLQFHGGALVDRFDAHSYRVLLDAMDTHDLARDRGEYAAVLQAMKFPVLVGSIASDMLYEPADQYELVRLLPSAQLLQIDSDHGHDGFLIDAARFSPEMQRFLNQI